MTNIPVTPGSGKIVSTTTIGGIEYQNIIPCDSSGNQTSTTTPFPVVTPSAVHFTVTPTITAGAYTSGQVVGGLISITGAARVSGGTGTIQTIALGVKTALTAPYDVIFFDTQPTNSTFTDNAALAVNVADLPFYIGAAQCSNLFSLGTPQSLQATALQMPYDLNTGTTLYAVIVIRGAQTFASTSAVVFNCLVLPN